MDTTASAASARQRTGATVRGTHLVGNAYILTVEDFMGWLRKDSGRVALEPQEALRARGHIVDVVSHAAGTA
jgi:hypothetical protein